MIGGWKDATDCVDGSRTNGTRTYLQNDQRSTAPRSVPGGVDGPSGPQTHSHRPRPRGGPDHRTAVAEAVSETGLRRFKDSVGAGQPSRISEDLAPTIQNWVQDGPQRCGLDRADWTYDELAAYLYQATGVEVKRTAMRDFCQRHGMRPYRPTYRYLRGDPEKQQVAREELAALKKSPRRDVRVVEPRRSALSPGANVTHHAGGEGAPSAGRDVG